MTKKKKSKKKQKSVTQTNILDESVEIDMEALQEKQEETIKQKDILFNGVDCKISVYIFS